MCAIEMKCDRCGVHLSVPDRKAGHHGRCPKCWASIKVPLPHADPHVAPTAPVVLHPWKRRLKILVPAGLAVILIVGLALYAGGDGDTAGEGLGEKDPEAVERFRQMEYQMQRFQDLVDRLKRYQDLERTERRLRARQVLGKMKAYEPVGPHEYQLRSAVQEEYAQESAAGSAREEEWRLNVPLSVNEVTALNAASDQLQAESAAISEIVERMGVPAPLETDGWKRRLLKSADLAKALATYGEGLQDRLDEARRKANLLR